MIGARGDHIKEIKDKFNQVQITFPDPGKKSDIVTLRGPKDDVDKCHKYLQQMHQDMVSFYVSLNFTRMHFRTYHGSMESLLYDYISRLLIFL
jgi:hypothetical protein